ncbi:MAG TPA: hypothetical protein VGC97_00280 [Pyrinomonadaceae bacterium]|jgi:hypothetical protein
MKKLFTKKIFCRHRLSSGEFCNALAATSDGRRLFFDGEPLKNNPHFIGFECPACGQLIKWRRSLSGESIESRTPPG